MNDDEPFIPNDLIAVAMAYNDADEQTKEQIRRILGVGTIIDCTASAFIGADGGREIP